ncbi:MAG: hypothetical protein AAF689_12205 [Pseudomonadota bacterium]
MASRVDQAKGAAHSRSPRAGDFFARSAPPGARSGLSEDIELNRRWLAAPRPDVALRSFG